MRPVLSLALSLALAAPLAAVATTAATAAQPVDVGNKVPAGFTALDITGKSRDFASITGKKGVVLVFFRSAAWCPYCQKQLKEIRDLTPELAKRGYTLAAISYDSTDALNKFNTKVPVNYTLLSDVGSKQIDAFGLRDPAYPKDNFAYGVPTATVLVIGKNGVIKKKLSTTDYKIRPSNETILASVDAG
ncbi:MAG: peroxiredoxin family protein [Sphingomonas sp.]|nr:peroxiredoxin family protein [Sphingomonas sp.]